MIHFLPYHVTRVCFCKCCLDQTWPLYGLCATSSPLRSSLNQYQKLATTPVCVCVTWFPCVRTCVHSQFPARAAVMFEGLFFKLFFWIFEAFLFFSFFIVVLFHIFHARTVTFPSASICFKHPHVCLHVNCRRKEGRRRGQVIWLTFQLPEWCDDCCLPGCNYSNY